MSKPGMIHPSIIQWLKGGDVSIQYQVQRDLLNSEQAELKAKIANEGWGASLLSFRNQNGHWGKGFYQPKWISSHYTLLEMKELCFPNQHPKPKASIQKIIKEEKSEDGGVNPSGSISQSDICINGMFLNYASWFHADENDLKSIVDFIIAGQMKDGGFNCRFNRSGAVHSSLHSTICVFTGPSEY